MGSAITKTAGDTFIEAKIIVAHGTPWERTFNLGLVSFGTPPKRWYKRLLWTLGRWTRRKKRRLVERQINAYRVRIERQGYTNEYIASHMAARAAMAEVKHGGEE